MALGQHKRAVGVFSNRRDAEVALRELRDSNFPMDRVSVITRDADRQDDIAGTDVRDEVRDARTDNLADEGAKTGAVAGGALGGLTGLLVGLGTLAIPGIGPIMLAGATATAIATTLAGGAIGAVAGSLLGGLIGLGIPEEDARGYNERVSRGHYLIVVEGTDEEISRAQIILSDRGIEDWRIYDIPNAEQARLGRRHRAVGVFPHRRNADEALAELSNAGFPMSQVSLVARDYDRHARITDLDVRDRFDNTIFGFPEERVQFYNDRYTRGEYLVIVHGSEDEISRAEAILRRHSIQEWRLFDAPDVAFGRTGTGTHRNPLGGKKRAVGVFPHRQNAEAALRELRNAGFNMDNVSVVGKNADRDDQLAGVEMSDRATGTKADEGAKAGAATGGALGGLTGLLVGLGALAIPGIGPVMAGGALATALATTAAGGAIGAAAGGLTGALVGLGIPEERAKLYNDRVLRGDYLVMVDGTEDKLRHAEPIVSRHGIQEWGIYDTSDVAPGRTAHATRDVDRTPTAYAAATTPRTGLGRYHRAIGVFPHRRDAETALRELREAGFNMNQVSLVGRDADGQSTSGSNLAGRTQTDEGAKAGAATGGALGGLGGLLVGLGALAIPGIGPVLAGGALATALATTVAGGAIGAAAGGLTGALVGLGIPDDRARVYNDRVNRGDYLVMVDGTQDEILRAEPILSRRGIQDWSIFDAPDADRSGTGYAERNVIDPNTTPGVHPTRSNSQVVDDHPEVIIVDRRDQTL